MQGLVLESNARGLLSAAHDCADGGLAVALAECCLATTVGLGARGVEFGGGDPRARLDAALFGEAQSRFVVGVPDEKALVQLEVLAAEVGVPLVTLGRAGGGRFQLGPIDVSLGELYEAYEDGLPRVLAEGGVEPEVGR